MNQSRFRISNLPRRASPFAIANGQLDTLTLLDSSEKFFGLTDEYLWINQKSLQGHLRHLSLHQVL